jgi:hypothetical protein
MKKPNVTLLAPPLEELQNMALVAVDEWAAAKTARPSPAVVALKLSEAPEVRRGGNSALIAGEAKFNGITPAEQASRVIAAVGGTVETELMRVKTKAAIRNATTHADVLAVLKARDIKLHTGPSFGR